MRALSNRILDALRAEGPMIPADLAIVLGEPIEAIHRTLARLPPGEVVEGNAGALRIAHPPVESAPAPSEPAALAWLPCPSYPRISEACYRGALVVGGLAADRELWSAEDESEALANLGDLHERVRWWVGAEGGAGYDRRVTGYAPDAAAGRRAVEACAEAIGFVGVGADGAVWGGA